MSPSGTKRKAPSERAHDACSRQKRAPLALILVAFAGLLASGCDNPFCAFGPNGCQEGAGAGGTGGIGSFPAAVPSDGDLILDGAPVVQAVFPEGTEGTPGSVVTLVMSESLDPASLLGSFELVNPAFGGTYPILQPPALTGGGRVVVLVPANPFQEGQSVLVRLTEDAPVADLTGQALSVDDSLAISEFSISAAPSSPQVVTVFPTNGSQGQSELSELVVLFDREIDAATVNPASFAVTVDQGAPPANPGPLRLTLPGAVPIPVGQVWTWRAVDGGGAPLSLGLDAVVDIVLSPTGNVIFDTAGDAVANQAFQFRTAALGAPLEVRKSPTAEPLDAIGTPQLSGGAPVLEIELATAAQDGDVLSLFLFGQGTTNQIAFVRRIDLTAGQVIVEATGDDLDLLTDNGLGRFLDGDLYVAARHGRGSLRSAVRMLDSDPDMSGVQPLLFDVTAPVLQAFGADGGSGTTFRSDHRGIVITGIACEQVGEAIVSTTTLGDNGSRTPVVASGPDGTFVAKPVNNPVPIDVVDTADLPQAFTIRLVDRAGNESAAVAGTFVQTGVVGGGAALPGPDVLVDVFDATTLAPISGARVMTQQDNGGTVTDRDSVLTDASGHAEPMSAASGETIVIVDAAGYDLFTFHGATSQRLQIPLIPTALATGAFTGTVIGAAGATFSDDTTEVADSRRDLTIDRFIPTQTCSGDPLFGLTCGFGPNLTRPRRLGAQAFVAANFDLNLGTFTASAFLRAFALRFPAPYLATGQTDASELFVPALLTNLPPEQQAIEFDRRSFSLAAAANLGPLDGAPDVSVEGVAPGFPGSVPVGRGLALDDGGGGFDVLGAYPGVVDGIEDPVGSDELGELVEDGSIEADLIVRVEALDTNGHRVGRRRRLSAGAGTMSPPDVPELLAPASGGSSGSPPYDLSVRNVIRDASGQGGLYHVTLSDGAGRDWHLWRPDPSDGAGDVRVHVSDLSGLGGSGLQNGSIVAQVSAHAWDSFSLSEFLWTDVERIGDQYGIASAVTYSQP